MQDASEIQRDTAKLALDRYKSLSEKIRGWLIIYGIGIAGLFVTQADTFSTLTTARRVWILLPAFAGVAIQLLLVISIKYANLITFKAHFPEEPLSMDSKAHVWAKWWAEAFWIDMLADMLTLIFYGVATGVLAFSVATTTAADTSACSTWSFKQGARVEHQEKGSEEKGGQEESSEEKDGQEENNKEEMSTIDRKCKGSPNFELRDSAWGTSCAIVR